MKCVKYVVVVVVGFVVTMMSMPAYTTEFEAKVTALLNALLTSSALLLSIVIAP